MAKVEVNISLQRPCGLVLLAIIDASGKPILLEQLTIPKNSEASYMRTFFASNPNKLELLVIDSITGKLLARNGSNELLNTTISINSAAYSLNASITGCQGTDLLLAKTLRDAYVQGGTVIPPDVVTTSGSKIWFWLFIVVLVVLLLLFIWWVLRRNKLASTSTSSTSVAAPTSRKVFQ